MHMLYVPADCYAENPNCLLRHLHPHWEGPGSTKVEYYQWILLGLNSSYITKSDNIYLRKQIQWVCIGATSRRCSWWSLSRRIYCWSIYCQRVYWLFTNRNLGSWRYFSLFRNALTCNNFCKSNSNNLKFLPLHILEPKKSIWSSKMPTKHKPSV